MKIERLQVYDYGTGEEREARGFLRGRTWFYEDGTPMTDVAVLDIKGHRDPRLGKQFQRMKAVENPDPVTTESILEKLRVKPGLKGSGRKSLGGDWAVSFWYSREHKQFAITLYYKRQEQTMGLQEEHVESRSRKRWMTDATWRLSPAGIRLVSESIEKAVEKTPIENRRTNNPQGYAPEYEHEPVRRRPPPPPPRRRGGDEEEWRKHLGYPPEGVTNPKPNSKGYYPWGSKDDSIDIGRLARLAKRHDFPGKVTDEESAAVASDWLEERGIDTATPPAPFMIPEYAMGTAWSVETEHGGGIVLSDLVSTDGYGADVVEAGSDQGQELWEALQDYVEYGGEPVEFQVVEGWFAHLSAPGYMDQTEWYGPFESEADAHEHIESTFDVDPVTGHDLS